MKDEVTFYSFYSGMRAFLSGLLKDPINADIKQSLKDAGLSKKKLINDLIFRGVIERHERILDKTNSDKEVPTYNVKYKVLRKNFERNMHRLYSKYFEDNTKSKKVNECTACGGCIGGEGSGLFSDTAKSADGSGPFTTVLGSVQSRGSIYKPKGNDDKKLKSKKSGNKNILLKESQLRLIMEVFTTETAGDKQRDDLLDETDCASVGSECHSGSFGYAAAPGFDTSKDPKFWKKSLDHRKIMKHKRKKHE